MVKSINRRGFLKLGAAGAAMSVLAGCKNPRRWVVLEPYVKAPEEQLAGVASWYASTCRQCPAGCGIIVRIMNGRAVKIEGNPEHPLNQGKLCARGQAGLQVLYNPDRLESPVHQDVRGSRQFQSITWEEGLNTLYSKIQAAGESVAFWLGSTTSGHLYDLFSGFAGAIGAPTPLIYDLYTGFNGYSAIEQANQELYGESWLPAYDLGNADVVLSFGADFLGAWLSSTRYGVEFGRFRSQSYGKRGYLVQFEPRMTTSGAKADRWLPLRPGTQALVAQGIALLIADKSYGLPDRVQRARALAAPVDIGQVAEASDLTIAELDRIAQLFANAEHPVAVPGSSLPGEEYAAEVTKAVQVLNDIVGAYGQTGGLWPAPKASRLPLSKPGNSSLGDALELIDRMNNNQVQVLMVYGANPAYDLPDQAGFTEALQKVPFVVSFAPIVDETAVQADMILPERTYLESWGYEMVSPSFGTPVVGSQQPVVEPLFDHRSTADVLLTIAQGIPSAAEALPWSDEVAYLKEKVSSLPDSAIAGVQPEVRWARFLQHGGWWPAAAEPSSQPVSQPVKLESVQPVIFSGDESEYPFFLHLFMTDLLSDGRGANQPWLQGAPDTNTTISWQTWVELNPATAAKLNLQQGDLVMVTSPYGEIEAAVYLYPGIRPDTIGIPLGQGHTDYGRYARDRGSNPIALVGIQEGQNGSQQDWQMPRVKIAPTGNRIKLATFEYSTEGGNNFINKDLPG